VSTGTRIIVPHRGLGVAKSRLAPVLGPRQRGRLARQLLEHVLLVVRDAAQGEAVVISPDEDLGSIARAAGATLTVQRGLGLNSGLAQARDEAIADGVTTLLVLHGDLPDLGPDDIAALAAAIPEDGGVAIAPDGHGTGTNALGMRPPGAIPFRFGAGSFGAHIAEAAARRHRAVIVERQGLAFDLDTPSDLASWLARGTAA
jgi:2-phospho-L-lactate guanylyltransferase